MIKKLSFIVFIIAFGFNQSNLLAANNEFDDFGLISIMYHRFDESKYPSTNIQLDIFKEQLKIIENEKIEFIHPKNFEKSIIQKKGQRKVLFPERGHVTNFQERTPEIIQAGET